MYTKKNFFLSFLIWKDFRCLTFQPVCHDYIEYCAPTDTSVIW